MSKQKTIGINPLEQYLSGTHSKITEPAVAQPLDVVSQTEHTTVTPALSSSLTPTAVASLEPALESTIKQRITIHLSTELIDRVKNAVFWEPGLTLAAFAEYALYQAVEKLEQERGAPYPQRREQNLRGGRPLK